MFGWLVMMAMAAAVFAVVAKWVAGLVREVMRGE